MKPQSFILQGFSEIGGFRVFAFEGIAEDRTRTVFTVKTDLALTRRYGIRLQELPLLCKAVLERSEEDKEQHAFTFTEQDMCVHAGAAALRQSSHKKKRQRSAETGQAGVA